MDTRQLVGSLRNAAVVAMAIAGAFGTCTASAASVYTYAGAPLTRCEPGPVSGTCYNWGPNLTGTLSFDEAVVTPDFTGTVAWNSAAWLSMQMTLATIGTTSNLYQPPGDFVFSNGQLVEWYLVPQFSMAPPLSYLINVFSSASGDRVSPINGFRVLGFVSSEGSGSWTRAADPTVPLPPAAWLLLSALGGLGALAPRRRASSP